MIEHQLRVVPAFAENPCYELILTQMNDILLCQFVPAWKGCHMCWHTYDGLFERFLITSPSHFDQMRQLVPSWYFMRAEEGCSAYGPYVYIADYLSIVTDSS